MEKAQDAEWKRIQQKTFTRWCNEQLIPTGKKIQDLRTDLEDGLILIALLDQLMAKKGVASHKMQIRYNKNPRIRAQKFENVELVLEVMKSECIKLVNINSGDIIDGNFKLILGLVWTLILEYHVAQGSPSESPKTSLLNWMDAALPDRHIKNFTTDWNDGIALSALINYCDPTLMPDFKAINQDNPLENCTAAMMLAKEKFDVPMVLSPEDMSNPLIDELSAMTYLSYFPRNEGPGWHAILNWVRQKVPELNVQNFQTDWNDGRVLCALAEAAAKGACPEWRDLREEDKLANCQKGLEAAEKLGITSTLNAMDFTSPDVDALGVMSYAARFQHLPQPPENV